MINTCKKIISSTFVFYCIATMIFFCAVDENTAKIRRLNALSRLENFTVDYSIGKEQFDRRKFYWSLHYYRLMAEMYPALFRPKELTGYCHYYLGKLAQSRQALMKALELNPHAFWIRYNLALILYRLGEQESAYKDFYAISQMSLEEIETGARLSSLNRLPLIEKVKLMGVLNDFARIIKDQSRQMALRSAVRLGKDEEALEIAAAASREFDGTGLNSYQLYWFYLSGIKQKEPIPAHIQDAFDQDLTSLDKGPFIWHPWSYAISPGKEALLN